MMLGAIIGFGAPWLLLALAGLPLLWLILRAVPPAPVRRMFPAVALLLGLRDQSSIAARTPWWLLLLRMMALAMVIIGLAGPVLNPSGQDKSAGRGPLLIVMDASWASARDWPVRRKVIDALLSEAGRAGRPVGLLRLSEPEQVTFSTSSTLRSSMAQLVPMPWQAGGIDGLRAALPSGEFDSTWLSDGLDHPARASLVAELRRRGTVQVIEPDSPLYALEPAHLEEGKVLIRARRLHEAGGVDLSIVAHGRDPAGNPAVLLRAPLRFSAQSHMAETMLDPPAQLRARISHFQIEDQRGAGSVSLSGDGLRRREVALIYSRTGREGLELLSPAHYLQKALAPNADLIDGSLSEVLPANPDVIVLADIASLPDREAGELLHWVDKGGLLLRFSGPRLAAADPGEDPLLPVRLRAGGRSLGGAMSWGAPRRLAPFAKDSPFAGLPIPDDVQVRSQVLAQPGPDLARHSIAALSDGTPLVTRKQLGLGQVVLFHVSADAEWSSLPLSGLFVQMLERLAISSAMDRPAPEDLAGTIWQPSHVLDGFGRQGEAESLPGVPAQALLSAPPGPDLRPGLYEYEAHTLARNVIMQGVDLAPASWPSDLSVRGIDGKGERPLGGVLLSMACLLMVLDVLAALALSGHLSGRLVRGGAMVLLLVGGLAPQTGRAQSGDEAIAIAVTSELVLAHVLTGEASVDKMAAAGLRGLSLALGARTSVEPATPIGVDLEQDELAFYPLLYWPISASQPIPSDQAYDKLGRYLDAGGMIVFDTRDGDISRPGLTTSEARRLRALTAPLNIPPLEIIPPDHVLTRTFYLLADFPGRHMGAPVWVEAAPAGVEQIEGMPFRNLNDNVTPEIIGGNDWASAWAIDEAGNPLVALGRGSGSQRQREIALRFGVNLVIHVLTGNYKSDQVHVPALLERLSQ